MFQQPPGGDRAAEPVDRQRVQRRRVGGVVLEFRRHALLADEHRIADRPRLRAQRVPAAELDVEHRLAGLEAEEQIAQRLRHRLRALRRRVGPDVDQLAGDESLAAAKRRWPAVWSMLSESFQPLPSATRFVGCTWTMTGWRGSVIS